MTEPTPSTPPPGRAPGPRSPRQHLGARAPALLALALGVALTVWGLVDWGARGEGLDELAERARALGESPEVVTSQAAREPDPVRARLALARELLARGLALPPGGEPAARSVDAVDPTVDPPLDLEGGADPAPAADPVAGLDRAAELARGVLAERPTSWEAASIAGAATYLAGALRRDPRLFTEHERWEEPLLLARELAPGREEPERFLATAYLELWDALSPEKQDLARELLAGAFRDDPTFERLAAPWLAAALSADDPDRALEEALAVIPDRPQSWARVQALLAESRRWDAYCRAVEAGRDALERHLVERIETAENRKAAGDLLEARASLLGVVTAAPVERRYAPLVERALAAAPPGPADPGRVPAMERWLRASLDPCDMGGCLVGPASLERLAASAPPSLGPSDPPDEGRLALAARAALAAGDPFGAEGLERRSSAPWSTPWTPYWIAKVKALVARGELAEARATLDLAPPQARERAGFWQAADRLATARGDRARALEARARLEALARESWPSRDWGEAETALGTRGRHLELLPAAPTRRLTLSLGSVPPGGAAVGLLWDGRWLAPDSGESPEPGCRVVTPGSRLRLPLEVTAEPHRLTLLTLAGGVVEPGELRLGGPGPVAGETPSPPSGP